MLNDYANFVKKIGSTYVVQIGDQIDLPDRIYKDK